MAINVRTFAHFPPKAGVDCLQRTIAPAARSIGLASGEDQARSPSASLLGKKCESQKLVVS
jgi:hypothetical protein